MEIPNEIEVDVDQLNEGMDDVEDEIPDFPPLKPQEMTRGVVQSMNVIVPKHRLGPLKKVGCNFINLL